MCGIMSQDLQNQTPNIKISLDEVGVTDFKTQISITRGTKVYRYTATVSVVINLPSDQKGAHLSRFVETISEVLSSEIETHYSLEEMSIHVLKMLNDRHDFIKASISLDFLFFTTRLTPVTKKSSKEYYKGKLITWWDNKKIEHELSLGTFGNTACPHALSRNSSQRTHIQRAYAEISLRGKTKDIPDMEDLSIVIDQSFSSPTFSLLKSEDEQWVVEKMHENPLFVEDVTRNLLELASKHYSKKNLKIKAQTISQESIHKHNVVSRGSIP